MYLTVCPPRGLGHDSSVGKWMNLTVCPPRGLGHDSSVGKWMNLTVCPPHGLGHDSTVGDWMYLTVCPLQDLGHDSSVGKWMNLTVCPPRGPGHDSSVGKWMNLTVCPPCGPGHDSSVWGWMYLTVCLSVSRVMIAQWENDCISLSVFPVARVQFPAMAQYFKGFFPGWSHSANPSWASMAENSSISPYWHRTTYGHRGGKAEVQPWTDDGWKKK